VWLKRPKPNKTIAIPIKNAISPTIGKAWIFTWSDKAIAYMYCGVNDIQHAVQQTVLFSSVYSGGHGFYVNSENLWQAAIIFSVRRLIKPTWLNDRDQFLQPSKDTPEEFKNDCLIWMLFNGSNLTASANDLEWNNKKWSIVNHFIPFSETEVNANGRFESDFMWHYLKNKELSNEAKTVLNAGQQLWQAYFNQKDDYQTQQELKLNRPDVGWYQIRNALKKRNQNENFKFTDFNYFEKSYQQLTEKLQPLVYELGFLKV
jgi:hypothetical protein